MEVDDELRRKDPLIRTTVQYALDSLIKAQYPNGAWPQRFSSFPEAAKFPVKRANYPTTWTRKHPRRDYRGYYTFNDNTIADMITKPSDPTEKKANPLLERGSASHQLK